MLTLVQNLTWLYEEKPFEDPQEYWGFVYIITNLSNNKKYIGKKQFYFKKTKVVKGKRKRILVDSDWKTYHGSNLQLNEDVKTIGEDQFVRTILRLCKSKSECSYWEAKYQFKEGVLEDDMWYNSWIMVKVHKSHIAEK